MQEIRAFFDGPVALSGAVAHGRSILAAQALGADFAYAGSMFIASKEANAVDAYKQDIVDNSADGIVYTNLFTGVHGNYLKSSVTRAGLDPDNLPESDPSKMDFGSNRAPKAWKEIWGSGQGIGAVHEIAPVSAIVDRLEREYNSAKADLCR
jgi:nitronate monooxygenase